MRNTFSLLALALVLNMVPSVPATAMQDNGNQASSPPHAMGIGLESMDYPFPVHFLPLTIEGQPLRMAYMDVPPASAAAEKTVVLLHGKNMGGYYFEGLIRTLNKNGYRVVVPDQIGWGKSSKPDIAYSFDLLSANTRALLDTLKIDKTVVLGHSTGGMLATRFARNYPERVTKLILEDPIGLEDYRRNIPPQSIDTLYNAELENTDPEKIRAFFVHYFVNPNPVLVDKLAEPAIRVTMSGEWPRWAKASALAYQMIYQQPVCYEFDLLQMPTLIVVGEEDHAIPLAKYAPKEVVKTMGNFPELARKAAHTMPHGEDLIIPQCGHIPHLERPDIFEPALLKFLSQ